MKSLLLAMTFLLIVPPHAFGEEHIIVFGGRYPPYYWMGKANGKEHEGRGMFIDFLDAFTKNNPDIQFKKITLPRKRMDEWIHNGKADVFSLNAAMFVKPGERQHLLFSTPLWHSSDHLAVLADSPVKTFSMSILKGKTVGFIHGNRYGQLDEAEKAGAIKVMRAPSMRMLLEMLQRKRLDAVVVNRDTVHHFLSLLDQPSTSIKILDPPLYEFDLCIMVHKTQPNLLHRLNSFIDKSRNNGLLSSLKRKWTKNSSQQRP